MNKNEIKKSTIGVEISIERMPKQENLLIDDAYFETFEQAVEWTLNNDEVQKYLEKYKYYGVQFMTGFSEEDPFNEYDYNCICECDGKKFYEHSYVGEDVYEEISLDYIAKELNLVDFKS